MLSCHFRRVTKNDQRFVYNGYLQIANFKQSDTNSQLTTHSSQLFIWDPTEPVATRPLVWNFSTFQPFNFSTSYYTHDGNKNVSEVVCVSGEVAAHYEYAPFGVVIVKRDASAVSNPWRFSSEFAEDDTATVYYNYRHYWTWTGRWMCRDPIEELAWALSLARMGASRWKLWVYHNSSDFQNQAKSVHALRRQLYPGIGLSDGQAAYFDGSLAVYAFVRNNSYNAVDELGALANWLAGCGVGSCWGAIGGGLGGAGGGMRGIACGVASGAVSGCAAGAACSSIVPQLCASGSCIAGILGSIGNSLCMQGPSALKDSCSWALAIWSASLGCLGGKVDDAELKIKLITWVLGVDVSAWSGLCGMD